jgi:uncharacterized HAD superfamily protein
MKDTRLRLGIDIDGVLSDFTTPYHTICEQLTGKVLPAEVKDWFQSNWNLTPEIHKQAWDVISNTKNFYLHNMPFSDILNFDMTAFSKKYRLYFITTRVITEGDPIEIQTAKWLSCCGIKYPTVLVEKQKGEIARALRLDAIIDDRPENLIEVSEKSTDTVLFLRDREWNQDADEKIKVPYTRVYSFQEFSDIVNNLSLDRQ